MVFDKVMDVATIGCHECVDVVFHGAIACGSRFNKQSRQPRMTGAHTVDDSGIKVDRTSRHEIIDLVVTHGSGRYDRSKVQEWRTVPTGNLPKQGTSQKHNAKHAASRLRREERSPLGLKCG
jgi:hypothetical protein